jgi:SAM-dependent methyltransferase
MTGEYRPVATKRTLNTLSRIFPRRTKEWARVHRRRVWPPVGMVRFGNLRRLRPIGESYGEYRGTPIDRYYIHNFMLRNSGQSGYVLGNIRGRVLEIGESTYTHRYGTVFEGDPSEAPPGFVTAIDVLHGDASNPGATIVGDLATGDGIPADTFDCIICIQTLPVIYDVHGVVANLHLALKPGGTVLVTAPGVSKLCRPDYDLWGDYWRFTSLSLKNLFGAHFPAENVTVEAYGNVLSATAMLQGLAAEELKPEEIDLHDPDYEVLLTVKATKA